jgi:tetratricopeptide (TPR) repeat protein
LARGDLAIFHLSVIWGLVLTTGHPAMPTFLFSATNRDGATITDRIDGETASGARYKLEMQGYTRIQFHTDDMEKHFTGSVKEDSELDPSEVLSPEQELKARRGGGALREIWSAWKMNAVFWVPLAIWLGFIFREGRPFSIWDWAGFVLSGFFLLYFIWIVLPSVAYQRLLEAGVWFRWNEVRRWVKFIRLIKCVGFVPIPDLELDFRVAYGLAAEGKLDEALKLVKKHDNPKVGKFMFLSRSASLYEAVGQYEQMTRLRREAAQHGTGNPSEKIDLALGLLRRERKPAEARVILEELEQQDIGDVAKLFVNYCQGLLAVEEENWQKADEALSATIEASAPLANNPIMQGMLNDIKAYHGITLARLGNYAEARKLIRAATPALKARKETLLLDRCASSLPTN